MSSPVRKVTDPEAYSGIEEGIVFEIDLSAFPETEPMFAYVDDVGSNVKPLSGLAVAGSKRIEGQPEFLWLKGTRDCVLLRATAALRRGSRVLFHSLGVGEFCVEIYHVSPEGDVRVLFRDDYCIK